MDVEIRREDPRSATASRLIAALNSELVERNPNLLDVHIVLHDEEVAPGRGSFVVARSGPVAVGCGAVRMIDSLTAELKRMYVVPAHRNHGVATALLRFLEAESLALGAGGVVLETGIHLTEAIALYRRAGYHEIPKFGPYVESDISLCMGKPLDPS